MSIDNITVQCTDCEYSEVIEDLGSTWICPRCQAAHLVGSVKMVKANPAQGESEEEKAAAAEKADIDALISERPDKESDYEKLYKEKNPLINQD